MSSLPLNYGYVIVTAGFLIFGGLLSPINSYGRLFTDIQKELNTTSLQTGWIGSIAWATNFLVSPVAVLVESRIGYCATTVLGSVMTSAAYLVSSFMGSYGWLLLVLGIVCGSSAGLCIHSCFCVLFKYFSFSNYTKASGLLATGAPVALITSSATIVVGISYEKLVPALGWRTTLLATSVFAAVLAIPASFAISPDRHFRGNETKTNTDVNEHKETASSKSTKTNDIKTESSREEGNNLHNNSWITMFCSWRAWLILFALLFPAMCWSVYWVNTISYFESIPIPENDILIFVTVMTVTDVLGRVILALFMNKVPFGETSLLCLCNFLFFGLTIIFVVCPSTPVLLICSACIGVGRGWYNVLPYLVSVDLLESDNSDQGVTLAMVALGFGFAVGTLPAGATYDAIGSYTYAFILNALLYLLGAVILLFLQMERRMRNKRKRHRRGLTVVYTIESAKAAIQG
ncbi:Monocarboxylate transporter 14 [Holothuria leucospilota]|uniref:Monocarboxylate transporter 14 n=1 Tax=Holothuria leucospilota TaxID=206669 RepID=A0A9Q0YQ68_HOLLE|nr:Monocarboxylate transporter 14 [Holothuria leucospilota]